MNTRFAVAVHILTLLAIQGDQPTSSQWIAGSVNTHAALIRRLLSALAKAGLTRSQLGAGGGALLARPAEAITLADVHTAVAADQDVLPMHPAPNPACPVGRHIQVALTAKIDAAERALKTELAATTVAQLAFDIATEAESAH